MKNYIERRGGKRPGAGKKKSTDPIVTYSVKISHSHAELLREWGGGDISAGLRWLVNISSAVVRKK
jgi:hypothetical protein